ncbi:MAG: polysaccharide deacetylase family protein [Alphaproteobacteria bacterium]
MRAWVWAARAAALALAALTTACLGSAPTAPLAAAPVKQIALTFDDAPLPDGPFLTGEQRAQHIIADLREAHVQTIFFANPGRTAPDRDTRLHAYAAAGHIIGNHTWDHPNLQNLSADDYIANITRADAYLRTVPGFQPIFRYPFLSEGDTVAKRDAVRAALVRMGYSQGYVTADSYDWRLDELARDAKAANAHFNMDALRDLYVQTAVTGADYADRMSRATLGRSAKQVMLMHENDIEALYLPDLIRALRRDGWTIISPTEAYADPIASELPDTLDLSSGRIAALMHAHHQEALFTEQRASYGDLDEPFSARVVNHAR